KMASMFLGILIILIINKQSLFYSYGEEIDYSKRKNLYDSINELYEEDKEYGREKFNDEIMKNNYTQNFEQLIRDDLKELSKHLMNFDSDLNENAINNVKYMSVDFGIDSNTQYIKDELVESISNIEYWFDKAMEYKLNLGYSEKTLKNFVTSVLWNRNNIKSTLLDMYVLLSSAGDGNVEESYLSLMFQTIQQKSGDNFCDEFVSEQQKVYYIFMTFIRTQFKAFATITRAYFIQTAMDQGVEYEFDLIKDYTMFKHKFDEKLKNFVEDSVRFMRTLSANIHRCNVQNPII
ncbi:hypothetical protein PV326_000981, partial [Microctonus aethiopoides]